MSIKIYGLVPLAVVEELQDMADDGEGNEEAAAILQCIPTWGFLKTELTSVQNGICLLAGKALLDLGVLPGGTLNSGVVLSQASMEGCVVLMTHDESLLKADENNLRLALISRDMDALLVLSPDNVAEYLAHINQERS